MTIRVALLCVAAWIVVGLTGCDNVEWAGASVELRHPPTAADTLAPDSTAGSSGPVEPEVGSILYLVSLDAGAPVLMPIGEIAGDSLRSLPTAVDFPGYPMRLLEDRAGTGQEFLLFRNGSRVGTLISNGAFDTISSFCEARPAAGGRLELIEGARGQTRFLAMARDRAPRLPVRTNTSTASTREQRDASVSHATEFLQTLSVEWPPSIPNARGDLQLLHLDGGETPAVTATFFYFDRMRIEVPSPASYTIFLLLEDDGTGYDHTYRAYRSTAEDGKGAPRPLDYLDWDQDGSDELLVEVLGAETSWFQTLNRGADGWSVTYDENCGAPS